MRARRDTRGAAEAISKAEVKGTHKREIDEGKKTLEGSIKGEGKGEGPTGGGAVEGAVTSLGSRSCNNSIARSPSPSKP